MRSLFRLCIKPCCKLLLESHFLQSGSLRTGIFLAAASVDSGTGHDIDFPKNRLCGGKTADSLSALADLCRISELWSLVLKPIRKRPAHAGRFFIISDWERLSCRDIPPSRPAPLRYAEADCTSPHGRCGWVRRS